MGLVDGGWLSVLMVSGNHPKRFGTAVRFRPDKMFGSADPTRAMSGSLFQIPQVREPAADHLLLLRGIGGRFYPVDHTEQFESGNDLTDTFLDRRPIGVQEHLWFLGFFVGRVDTGYVFNLAVLSASEQVRSVALYENLHRTTAVHFNEVLDLVACGVTNVTVRRNCHHNGNDSVAVEHSALVSKAQGIGDDLTTGETLASVDLFADSSRVENLDRKAPRLKGLPEGGSDG